MIGRLRALMRGPFARPPGPRRWWKRFAPELCAGLVYVAWLASFWWSRGAGWPVGMAGLLRSALWAYGLAAGITLLVPLAQGAASIVSERERGTIESMVLAPVRPADLVWGRYLRVALPWMRFMLWMLPLYLVLSTSHFFEGAIRQPPGPGLVMLFAAGPRGLAMAALGSSSWGNNSFMNFMEISVPACLVRWLRDAWNIMLVVALGMHISARSRSTLRALLLAFLIVPLTMAVVFSLPEALGVAATSILLNLGEWWGASLGASVLYPCFVVMGVVFEILVARRALRLVAWNFAPFATGEKAESWWKAFEDS